ncbi:Arp4 subunit of the NuA4 histone acetyltransferase complex [Candida orthopsilosis Co 90-125]|uniref:Actin-related protein 4 n=1 Tax=Candida orthopsilosis (strain 90-125) TaxID=1136231 RepID=H8XB90_CANO9|nr:Arp4 subunit of the NuA4 histone acetyltransferase complex [Candida orthopsilosis Co 90-125]CCG25339.1 Arp4 subunit of the NuA4 histone acetyltransferase complex [Candida orthopsilosis Co 90-125]
MSSTANTVYGGDEINAIVLDIGSFNIRIGYAGDDFPKVITSSYYGQLANGTKVFGEGINVSRKEPFEVKPIVEDSLIVDWDAAYELFAYYFQQLKIIDKEQPILITEPIWSTNEYRTKLIELIYEKFEFPGLYLAKVPSCVSFQQGRANCLVVDLGHESISVTPVVDGICLIKSSLKVPYAGKFLNSIIEDYITKEGIAVEPSVFIKSKTATTYPEEKEAKFELKDNVSNASDSFKQYQIARIWHEFKESMLEVPSQEAKKLLATTNSSSSDSTNTLSEFAKRSFELPTGQSITLGQERFEIAETLFDPSFYKFNNPSLQPPASNGEIPGIEFNTINEYRPVKRTRKNEEGPDGGDKKIEVRGVAQLVTQVISIIDIDLRASLANNIIVTGGTSLVTSLTERLYHELSNNNPGLKIRLHAVGNSLERINQSWIGGSVLSSLGTFHQMWVSEKEYKEEGAERILNQRFR